MVAVVVVAEAIKALSGNFDTGDPMGYPIPTGLGTAQKLRERANRAFSTDALWQDLLQDSYEYFLPQRDRFTDRAGGERGQKKMDRIFDGTAQTAIKQFASKIQEQITPIWRRWATFGPSDEIMRLIDRPNVNIDEKEIREQLEEYAEIVFDYLNRSNFATQINEFYLDLAIGTGAMTCEEADDDDSPIEFNTVPQDTIALEEGRMGKIDGVWRKHQIKARNILEQWPAFLPSEKLQRTIDDKPDTKISLLEGVLKQNGMVHAFVLEEGSQDLSWYFNYGDTSPFIVGRWAVVAGEVRGRGPALDVLPDVRSLNKAKEFVLKKAAIDLAGIYTATDDGVTNPYNIRIAPGIVLPVGSNNSQNPSIMRLDTSTNLQLAEFEISELQNNIKTALFNDMRDPAGPVRSATEVAIEARDLASRMGSAFGRLQTEVLVPVLQRVASILQRRGIIEPIKIGGKEVAVKFTSPLARAQDTDDLLAAQQAYEFTLATAGPEMAQLSFKVEDFGSFAAEKMGMPSELVRSQSEKQQVAGQAAQVAQTQMEQGKLPQAANQ